jgi:FkbM family methyltransferase
MIDGLMDHTVRIEHKGLTLDFVAPNDLNRFRIATFSTKEPGTLEWIDAIAPGSVMWDIGANIGLYTIYAAKARECSVFAFEPSVFNLELLARNVYINDVVERVCLVPLALSDRSGSNSLNMTSKVWGRALSTFGNQPGWDGKLVDAAFKFRCLRSGCRSLTISSSTSTASSTSYFRRAGPVLEKVKGVLVEMNDDFGVQARESEAALRCAGLVLKEERHSAMFDGPVFANSFNQIWARA